MKKEYWLILGILAISGGAAYFYFRRTSKQLEGTTPQDAEVLRKIRIV
jgi:LPXTG-motif cell wall-anchored protein